MKRKGRKRRINKGKMNERGRRTEGNGKGKRKERGKMKINDKGCRN